MDKELKRSRSERGKCCDLGQTRSFNVRHHHSDGACCRGGAAKEGRSVRVVNARLSSRSMKHAEGNPERGASDLTIEEAVLQGGFGSSILEFAHEHQSYSPIIDRMGIPDQFIEHGSVAKLLEEIGMTKKTSSDE
ncbi:transketolase C-terminal domain-containing protein [Bacillus licheniformis]|nr:transketolase C-terminal domain-containing protein [Bacillus licheniformis]